MKGTITSEVGSINQLSNDKSNVTLRGVYQDSTVEMAKDLESLGYKYWFVPSDFDPSGQYTWTAKEGDQLDFAKPISWMRATASVVDPSRWTIYIDDVEHRPVYGRNFKFYTQTDYTTAEQIVDSVRLDKALSVHSISGIDESEIAIESEVSVNNHKITDLAAPSASDDAANKGYVDSTVNALLPPITETANGKILGVVNGQLAWVDK